MGGQAAGHVSEPSHIGHGYLPGPAAVQKLQQQDVKADGTQEASLGHSVTSNLWQIAHIVAPLVQVRIVSSIAARSAWGVFLAFQRCPLCIEHAPTDGRGT